jgi:cell division protein FtsL
MVKVFNAFLVLCLLVSGFFLYSLEHSTRGLERQIAKLKNNISGEREQIKLLNAEWSSLTRPERIQKLAEEKLKLQSLTASQIVTVADLASKVPDHAKIKVDETSADPIGDILAKMQ